MEHKPIKELTLEEIAITPEIKSHRGKGTNSRRIRRYGTIS
jgi:hypothetical protein